jgi:dolichol-phosphate mannosyltransferase
MNRIDKKFLINDTLTSVIVIIDQIHPNLVSILQKIDEKIQERSLLYEIVCIDNTGVGDNSKILQNIQKKVKNCRIIYLSKQYSNDVGLTVGIDSSIGDYVIFYDLRTDTPNIISVIFNQLTKGHDVVIGNPNISSKYVSWISRLFLWITEHLSKQGYFYRFNYTVGLSRKAVAAITRTRRKNRNFTYLNSVIGLKKTVIGYQSVPSIEFHLTKTSFPAIFLNVLNDVISNSFKPIRWISLFGMLGSVLFLIYIFIIIFLVVVFNMTWIAPQGWISLATVIGGMFFLLFSSLTIMSEYLIRIMDESRNEPLYYISSEVDSSHRIKQMSRSKRAKRLNILQS